MYSKESQLLVKILYMIISHMFLANGNSEIQQSTYNNISVVGNEFVLNGRPFRIVSGSVHYFRLPIEYWRDRLRKLKAAGLNSVSTYVEWSYHEPDERHYLFHGDRDVARFVQMAAEEDLYVLLRVGPYIGADRDMGGLPYWLLSKYPRIKLRTTNEDFIHETKIWMAKLFHHVGPLLFGNGGPIILVQVENEYGSYGSDKNYMEKIRDIISDHVDTNAILYTTDGSARNKIEDGMIDGTLTTINFGNGKNQQLVFNTLRRYQPHGPLMNSGFYPGWVTRWGEQLQQVSGALVVRTMRKMLDSNINVNFYMFAGGSNFGFSAGANYDDENYQPDTTSFDYDAPLNEGGDPTPKYYAIREAMKKYNPDLKDTLLPVPSPKTAYGKVSVKCQISLLSPEGWFKLGKKYKDISGEELPTFERLRQRAGLILYETSLNDTQDGLLHITEPRDWIYVYLDNEYKGIICRMFKSYNLYLKPKPGSILSLLVENQGRITTGSLLNDFKGILSPVMYNGKILNGTWTVTGYPLDSVKISVPYKQSCKQHHGPVLYHGYFKVPSEENISDTFLDTSGWGKGYVWINSRNLGRYWPKIGPQITLYVPGAWLKAAPAKNHIQILELECASVNFTMEFIDYPILNRTGSFVP